MKSSEVRRSIGTCLILFGFSFAATWSAQQLIPVINRNFPTHTLLAQAVLMAVVSVTTMVWGLHIVMKNESVNLDERKDVK
ncbi:MAG: hypothetical protein JRN15_02255 [Nitrososphaerota archaeon]|nr:hypothetical protein [Nitrososphaerota archaeon]